MSKGEEHKENQNTDIDILSGEGLGLTKRSIFLPRGHVYRAAVPNTKKKTLLAISLHSGNSSGRCAVTQLSGGGVKGERRDKKRKLSYTREATGNDGTSL